MNEAILREMKGCACGNLRATTRVVTRLYDDVLRPSGLRVTQLNVMVAVALHQAPTVTELAEALETDQTTLTRNLKVLQKDGLIRFAEGEDRRKRIVALAKQGEAALERAYPLWQQAQSALVEALGGGEFEALLRELMAVRSAMKG
jgi:DNA-binding MarR family transcriptional regulator